eukprot:CAMPEP_0178564562 /NCGR_PEP_ID=MMETSP0697-20121206/13693_1 /TAXON_ID=265572 /ORGANISM="Extubocellulus spinifer, Strain CCMP396" /LENGTH=244 /DNA_ID=CAMNT_0020198107 /DNA_START=146 /DNA_END=880 /DNA_ORIENTATION=+
MMIIPMIIVPRTRGRSAPAPAVTTAPSTTAATSTPASLSAATSTAITIVIASPPVWTAAVPTPSPPSGRTVAPPYHIGLLLILLKLSPLQQHARCSAAEQVLGSRIVDGASCSSCGSGGSTGSTRRATRRALLPVPIVLPVPLPVTVPLTVPVTVPLPPLTAPLTPLLHDLAASCTLGDAGVGAAVEADAGVAAAADAAVGMAIVLVVQVSVKSGQVSGSRDKCGEQLRADGAGSWQLAADGSQ